MEELVLIRNNQAMCDSLLIAENFHKRHDKVIRSVENLEKDVPNFGEMFKKSSYKDSYQRDQPMYYFNRDGFALLVMGFTGKEALEWKLKYITAFNQMEKMLLDKQSLAWQETRLASKTNRRMETDEIKLFVEYAKQQGSQNADKYYMILSRMANKAVGIRGDSRDSATISQLNNLALAENIISQVIKECIVQHMPYKDIYKSCKARVGQFAEVAYLTAAG